MNSQWVRVKPKNELEASGGDIAKHIKDLIEWYDDSFTRKEDDYVKANLKLIMSLAENVKDSEDVMFIERMTDTFCHIIKKQREVIESLECTARGDAAAYPMGVQSLAPVFAVGEGFSSDEQLRAVFIAYMTEDGKSSFTINDYILRIQNLWRAFFAEYQAGDLPSELAESVSGVRPESPLLNAYNHIEVLNGYICMKIAADGTNRNWANVRASFNKFGEAVRGGEYRKVKAEPKEIQQRDFSKYLFEGERYGKSRLVLAVVRRFVEDNRPLNFDTLEAKFPPQLQGSLGVVRLIDTVSEKYKGIGGVKRYFVAKDEIIRLPSGEDVIVCTQWGTNIDRFVEYSRETLGYEIGKI